MLEYEDLVHQHYTNFTQFLGNRSSSTANFLAKNKLAKLSSEQFSELATDVNDEINRRKSKQEDHLPAVNEYSVKRNQARQKLCTLNDKRFMDLASDVLAEILRRFPEWYRLLSKIYSQIEVLPASSSTQNIAKVVKESSPHSGSKFHSVAISKFDTKQNNERNRMIEYEKKMTDYQSQITDYELKNLELEAKIYVSLVTKYRIFLKNQRSIQK
jgi:hypothetical protein